jgi:hypothetical protein
MVGKRRYVCDDRMTLESCYWAGFIASDGHINPVPHGLDLIRQLNAALD